MPDHGRYSKSTALSRRAFLGGTGASLAFWGNMPSRAVAAPRDPRLLVVILRGGLDGLSLIAPVGDPDYLRLRGSLALPTHGPGAATPLDGIFALNRNATFLAELFKRREALAIHAISTPYRGRSHFDGQDVLESGLGQVARVEDGWLNRSLAAVPSAGGVRRSGLAMGAVVPLVIRGRQPIYSWIPPAANVPLRESTIARLSDLYAATDPQLAAAFAEGIASRENGRGATGNVSQLPLAPDSQATPFPGFVVAAETAGRFLASADGPRIGALSFEGWDTHAHAGAIDGQLGRRLGGLDLALRALHDALGPAWSETVVALVTEFGRTVRPNGSVGTDHGIATCALLLGGRVNGGRVIADWPGLSEKSLYEGRDLAATVDLRSVLKGVMRDHLGLSAGALDDIAFPGSGGVKPYEGLLT
jgi:uncharacterized protein (DUF1501 family)